ncbi:unnamed protein product [Chilo suppressalis]|uniref:RRM domain-containing protein n=1 Tax=Chilo suppressalis TaxID=168631 RepID=A0ABN8LCG0_CHISP|nr:unnamed protein product [Chilo suppressalis]
MTQYFKQFGMVTNARVIRSKRTGHSKGFAFVEFRDPAVAEIVADTMNNYLMGKRLIKAVCIPPEKQKRFARRKHWNAVNNPSNNMRIKMKKEYNTDPNEEGELKRAKKMLSTFHKMKRKLSTFGINYDIFSPVDVPEELSHLLAKPEVKQEKVEENKNDINKIYLVKEKNKKEEKGLETQTKKENKKSKKNAMVIVEKKVSTSNETVAVQKSKKAKQLKLKAAESTISNKKPKIGNEGTTPKKKRKFENESKVIRKQFKKKK